jgi:tetratricopeptide (TPR) repeat protein
MFMRKILSISFFIFCVGSLFAQKQTFDSLGSRLSKEKIESNRVKLMWMMADASNLYAPDTSLRLAENALYLAQKIKYVEGESRSLGILAVALREMGNYQKSLEFFLQKLQIEEKRNSPRNLASVLINIGIVYVYLEQYPEALSYYRVADSVIETNQVEDLKYYINNNLGDAYERLNINDSAFLYFNRAIAIATKLNDGDLTGTSIIGLGHVYRKQKQFSLATQSYKKAIALLQATNDEDFICEASLGLAKTYNEMNKNDSADYYGTYSFTIAKKDGFESRQLEAAEFLTDLFKTTGNISKAFSFLETTEVLKDSISSKDKIRALQIISSNEQLRQNEIAETKRRADEERQEQLQMLLIGIFIPVLFMITVLLNRVRIHQRIIKFLGIISLLMLFEYLLLLLHPKVVEFTNHVPVFEILIFVAIASVLIPAHHRVEHWLIDKLTTVKVQLQPVISEEPNIAMVPLDENELNTEARSREEGA